MRLPSIIALALVIAGCSSDPARTGSPGTHARDIRTGTIQSDGIAEPVPEAPSEMPSADASSLQGDVWHRLRAGLSMDRHLSQPVVREKLAFYARKQEFLDRVAERARPYLFYIAEALQRRNLPAELALLPIVESAYQPFAYSRSRASGIWQFIPGTGKRYGLKQNWWYDGRRDVIESTRAALDYLERLNQEFNGDWLLALAAYNAGEMNVQLAVDQSRKAGRGTDFFSLRLPRETRGYVPSLLAVAELLADAGRYNVHWQPIPNIPYFSIVEIDGQIDMDTAARLARLSRDEFRHLNPGFSQWATDPDGPHRILVPVAAAVEFAQGVAQLPPDERVKWQQHVVRSGDTLGGISRRYHTSVDALRTTNSLRGNLIRVGQVLLIPSGPPAGAGTFTVAATSLPAEPVAAPLAAAAPAGFHTVRPGDTLWDIGRRHGVSPAQLAAWNGLGGQTLLQPGQKLRVSMPESPPRPASLVAAAYVNQLPAASYTVRQGDSLWLISKRFGVSVAQLQEWNRLRHGSVLQPGQTLIVSEPDAATQDV
ncbi:MAG: LysM peptidoglycan-binding domain-containing protein [Gammaproteobacteria bacterium]|nr:LysM peptidoglycan-binding domain-containing protein [Gammaproteobacteria bacterium]